MEISRSSSAMIQEKFKKPNGELINRLYFQGKALGEGGFATCCEFTNIDINKVYAAKIISKAVLRKNKLKQKVIIIFIISLCQK